MNENPALEAKLQTLGIRVNPTWLRQAMFHIQQQILRGQRPSSSDHVLEHLMCQFLFAPLTDSSLPCLPKDILDQRKSVLNGRFILQIVDITNIGENFEKRKQENSNRILKIHFTDGHNHVFGIEYDRIPALSISTPLKTKVVLQNVPVRLGMLHLTPSTIWILGNTGSIQPEQLESEEKEDESRVGINGLNSARNSSIVSSNSRRNTADPNLYTDKQPYSASFPVPQRQNSVINSNSHTELHETDPTIRHLFFDVDSTRSGPLSRTEISPGINKPKVPLQYEGNGTIPVSASVPARTAVGTRVGTGNRSDTTSQYTTSDATSTSVALTIPNPPLNQPKRQPTQERSVISISPGPVTSKEIESLLQVSSPPRRRRRLNQNTGTDQNDSSVNVVKQPTPQRNPPTSSPPSLHGSSISRPSPVIDLTATSLRNSATASYTNRRRRIEPFEYLSELSSQKDIYSATTSMVYVKAFIKSVANFQYNSGEYDLSVNIDDGSGVIRMKVDPKFVESLMGVSCKIFMETIKSNNKKAMKWISSVQFKLQVLQGIMEVKREVIKESKQYKVRLRCLEFCAGSHYYFLVHIVWVLPLLETADV